MFLSSQCIIICSYAVRLFARSDSEEHGPYVLDHLMSNDLIMRSSVIGHEPMNNPQGLSKRVMENKLRKEARTTGEWVDLRLKVRFFEDWVSRLSSCICV